MKIGIITHYWINSAGGGVREYTRNFVEALSKMDNVKVNVIFREGEDPDNFKMPENKIKFIWHAYKTLKKIKPDAMLSQGGWFTEIPAVLYKFKNPSTRIFVLFHTQYDKEFPHYKCIFYNFLINKFDRIGFVSKALEKNIREVAGLKIKKDTFILYAGAKVKEPSKEDIEKFRKRFKIPDNKFILLGLGLTALHYKAEGAKLLIQAVKILKARGEDVILILTRKGRYSPMLREFAQKIGVEDSVIFTGDIDNPYIPLAICDVYTHIPLGEGGVSISLLETMAMGKPIIATPVGGIPEAIENGKNGILVEPNPEKIADAIKKLIRDRDLCKRLGDEAKKTAEEKFTWEKTAENFLKLLEY